MKLTLARVPAEQKFYFAFQDQSLRFRRVWWGWNDAFSMRWGIWLAAVGRR